MVETKNRIYLKVARGRDELGRTRFVDSTEYDFSKLYEGKFVVARLGSIRYFQSAGIDRGDPLCQSHSEINFLREGVSGGKDMEVIGAGYLAISPEKETVIFHGRSDHFGRSFKHEDILPAARYMVTDSNGRIKHVLSLAEDDPEFQKSFDPDQLSGPMSFLYKQVCGKRGTFIFGESLEDFVRAASMLRNAELNPKLVV